jgi:cold shock CspA family protein
MTQKIDQNSHESIKDLFVQERPHESSFSSAVKPETQDEKAAEEFESTIYNLSPNGYGFIKNEEKNNIFFHYSKLANCDFSDLRPGMKVRYAMEEDQERSKQNEMPCFRAGKVTLIE